VNEPDLLRVRVNELLRRTSTLLASRRDMPATTKPRHEAEILALYARASSHFEAIMILIRRDHPEEAFILIRSLFVESLRLRELAEADTTSRIALIAGWTRDSLKRLENIQLEIERRRTGSANPGFIARLRALRKQSNSYAKRHGLDRARDFTEVRERAAKQRRQDEFGDYAFSQDFVHGGFTSHFGRYRQWKEGEDPLLELSITTPDPRAMTAFAVKSVVLAHKAAAEVFSWADDTEEELLLKEAERLGREAEHPGHL
jgi:hypothetical protein